MCEKKKEREKGQGGWVVGEDLHKMVNISNTGNGWAHFDE